MKPSCFHRRFVQAAIRIACLLLLAPTLLWACPEILNIAVNPSLFCTHEEADLTFAADWSADGRKTWDDTFTWQYNIQKRDEQSQWQDRGTFTETIADVDPAAGEHLNITGPTQGEGGKRISVDTSGVDGAGIYRVRVRARGQWTDNHGVVHREYASDSSQGWSGWAEFQITRADAVAVTIADFVSVGRSDIPVIATVMCGSFPAVGIEVTFTSSDLTFAGSHTATASTDNQGKATITAASGSTPSSSAGSSSVSASVDNGIGQQVSGSASLTVVQVNDPTPASPRILDGHYSDDSLYSVLLTYTVSPVVGGVPVEFSFEPYPTGQSFAGEFPATLEDPTSATDAAGKATVRVRSSDVRETRTVECTFEESTGKTPVMFEGITSMASGYD